MSEPATTTSGEIPRRIGPYEIQETIGRGGMAAVYRAYQPSLDRVVAIKVISAHLASEPEFMERFRQEARAIARLSHPNILIVHDFGEENGVPYLVMELVDGPTLADLIEKEIALEEIPPLAIQVASGLDYAHSRGIVHRDIKPQNVLLTSEGRAVLADFGLARMMENAQRLTMSGGIVGTPEYMSPEQAAGRATDHRTDIYALGVILYEMAAGSRPFTAETPLGVLMKHLQEPVPPLRQYRPELPLALEAVMATALAKKPEERYQSAGELVRAYQEACRSPDASVSTAPTGAPKATTPPPPTRGEPPAIDISKYAGLRQEAEKAPRPHETPSMASLHSPPVPFTPLSASTEPSTEQPQTADGRPCPECGTLIPPGDSTCPNCFYMLPFQEIATQPWKKEPERSQVNINLLPYSLAWTPPGLERARQIAHQKAEEMAAEGWELTGQPELVQGRSARGGIVAQVILTLQRQA